MVEVPHEPNAVHAGRSSAEVAWTTINARENLPGVVAPITWSLYNDATERALRLAFAAIGVLKPSETHGGVTTDERVWNVFYGRVAANMNTMRGFADRSPGTSGSAMEEQIFGRARPGMEDHPDPRRYPVVAIKMPLAMLRLPRQLDAATAEIDPWWRRRVGPEAPIGLADGQRVLTEIIHRFHQVMPPHHVSAMVCQGLYEQMRAVAEKAGRPGLEIHLMTGYGSMAETAMVADLWATSKRLMSVDEFILRHGFHGPAEGDVRSSPWRMDRSPLERMLASYRAMGDERDPRGLERARAEERRAAERELLDALPRGQRPGARLLLRTTAKIFPTRGIGKVGFLQCVDATRTAALACGSELASAGGLESPADAIMLTLGELLGATPASDFRDLAARRRAVDDAYRCVELPEMWEGTPEPVAPQTATASGHRPATATVTGVPVSAGTVEGTARVARDPIDAQELEPGEILVCQTTDPAWASVMMISAALVIDIGGPLSHGAIVARELGIPCVIGTKDGTRVIATGDRVAVDGAKGEVRVLSRHAG